MNTTKIKPYPFPITLIVKNTPYPVHVMKMTNLGFICQATHPMHLMVGHNLEANIQLPLGKKEHVVKLKVIKTLDYVDKTRLIELHFINPPSELIQEIMGFVKKIGQE
jgi:uncharacterized membrane protein YagU involved in acid resistance